MCIICVSPARTRQPSISQIKTMFKNNPHGAGYMFARDGRVQIHKGFMDLEDFIVSNVLLPVGSLLYVLFCTTRRGWGWNNFFKEINTGEKGARFPAWLKPYVSYVLPVIIVIVLVMSVI